MSDTRLIDLAEKLPPDIVQGIGLLTIMFGRLEHLMLLAIKRKRGIPLVEATKIYKHYSMGAKLNGKNPCSKAGDTCRDYNCPPGLKSFCDGVSGLEDICNRIQQLTEKRNQFLHGLVSTVQDEITLSHNSKIFSISSRTIEEIKNEIEDIIYKLNDLIPIPGIIEMGYGCSPAHGIVYGASALDPKDPIVSKIKDTD